MKKIFNLLVIWSALSLLPLHYAVGGESIAVIVNKANQQQLTAQQIKNIYGDIVIEWENGSRIDVYNLPVDEVAREAFSQKIFGQSARQLASAEANRKITNTIKNPSKTKSARLVAKLVSRNVDAIGYVPLSLAKKSENIRIIMQID